MQILEWRNGLGTRVDAGLIRLQIERHGHQRTLEVYRLP